MHQINHFSQPSNLKSKPHRKYTYDGTIKPLLFCFEREDRQIFQRPERKHHFEFLKKYEPPSNSQVSLDNFQFRQDRSSSIKTMKQSDHMDRTFTPIQNSLKMPSFHNRKNVSQSIHEIFTTSDPTIKQLHNPTIRFRIRKYDAMPQ